MKILLLSNIPSPYMVDFLNELGKLCELTAVFERECQIGRNEIWKNYRFKNFKGVVLKGLNISKKNYYQKKYGIKGHGKDDLADQAICFQVINYIDDSYDKIIVANPCTPTGIIEIFYMRLKKIPYVIQSEGGVAGSGRGLKERFKKILLKDAELYLSGAYIGDKYFEAYGATPKKIFRYPFTSLYENDVLKYALTVDEKEAIKRKIGIKYKKMVITVGRFIPKKGIDVLINSCSMLQGDVGIYIVGGTPTNEYVELKEKLKLSNLHFLDFMKKNELFEYYKAADLFVFASRGDIWGLVINEAMACGLPVISSDKCVAALELINEGENGYIVPVDDVEEMYKKMEALLENEELRYNMGNNNVKKIKKYTYENMASTVMEILKY